MKSLREKFNRAVREHLYVGIVAGGLLASFIGAGTAQNVVGSWPGALLAVAALVGGIFGTIKLAQKFIERQQLTA